MRRSAPGLAGLLLLLALPALPGQAQETPAPVTSTALPPASSSLETNREVVRRYIEEALSGGDLKALDTLVAADYADSSPGADEARGPEAVRAAQGKIRALFRDIHYHLDQLVAEGDKVVARYTVHAVRKPDETVDAGDAGKEIGILGMTIFRLVDGRIRETWTINDQLTLFRQLGYTLTPPNAQKPVAPARPAKPPGR